MKIIGTFTIAILVALAATTYAVSSTWGNISSRDKVLNSERVFNYSSRYGISRSVQFPKQGKANRVNITGIQAIDYSNNGTATWATLMAGGPGFTFAKLTFNSRQYYGLDYQLVIYGR